MEECNPASRLKQRSVLKKTRHASPNRQRSISSMRSTVGPSAQIDQLLKEVTSQIRTNGELISQIGDIDQEILRMQLEIANMQQEYAFAEQQQSGPEEQQKASQLSFPADKGFLGHQVKLKLLPHLRCVLSRTLSATSHQLLGVENHYPRDDQSFICTPYQPQSP